jgi:HEAT repeat protein
MQPVSVHQIAGRLDIQDLDGLKEFLGFCRRLGEPEVDLLVAVIGQSGYRRTRRVLSEAVARRCRDNPERLAPWLADPRVTVVRNVVHILGTIGTEAAVPLLETVAQHAEPQVGYAVVAALARAPLAFTRSVLLELLEGADTRRFCSVLLQLGRERNEDVARRVFEFVRRDDFDRRPATEQRAAYVCLGETAGDELVLELENELMRGGWLSLQPESHRAAIARCLARIGTAASMQALERGTRSRRGAVRRACEEALLGWAPRE